MTFDLLSGLGEDEVMTGVFGERRTVGLWLLVEAELARSLETAGVIEAGAGARIAAVCRLETVDLPRLWRESRNVGYPIFPLVRQICEALPPADAAHVHYGATTQDIMDTALARQLRDASDRLAQLLDGLGDALARLVQEHAGTVMAGRTHAQQAVPTTFGAKCAVFLGELTRHRERLARATRDATVVSLFGAGGTSAALGPRAGAVRAELARRLGLSDIDEPWHVARDRVAGLTQVAALAAATGVRLGREVVDLSRTEIGEVAEADGLYRGASSTMPQKANPISSELAVGFGVMAEVNAQAVLRAAEAGHERAAGEWQVEWQAVPATLTATAGALRAATAVAGGLRVFPGRMRQNLDADGGRLMSEAYMISLAARLGRDRAHELVYRAVRSSRESGGSLRDAVRTAAGEDVWASVEPHLPGPEDYVGSARAVCARSLENWWAAH